MKLAIVYYYEHNKVVIYVGSTSDICQRHSTHKTELKLERKNQNFYLYLKENDLKIEDLTLHTISLYVESDEEKRKYEQYHIDLLKPLCNGKNAYTSIEEKREQAKEYHQKNRDWVLQRQKDWYKNNREKELQRHSEYRKKNIKNISQYWKEYNNKNKEIKAQRFKEWYKKNKGKRAQKINCYICGNLISKGNLSTHQKTSICNYNLFIFED